MLGLSELLELILMNLPMRDLLFAQSVSKFWKEVIANSSYLQKALFFKPSDSGKILALSEHNERDFDDSSREDAITMCKQIAYFKVFPDCIEHYEPEKARFPSQARTPPTAVVRAGVGAVRIVINPLLVRKFDWFREFFCYDVQTPAYFPVLDPRTNSELIASAARPDASWRRMFITQPPLANLTTIAPCGYYRDREPCNMLRNHPTGEAITMERFREGLSEWSQKKFLAGGIEKFDTRCDPWTPLLAENDISDSVHTKPFAE